MEHFTNIVEEFAKILLFSDWYEATSLEDEEVKEDNRIYNKLIGKIKRDAEIFKCMLENKNKDYINKDYNNQEIENINEFIQLANYIPNNLNEVTLLKISKLSQSISRDTKTFEKGLKTFVKKFSKNNEIRKSF